MHQAKLISITPNAQDLIMYCARVSNPANQSSADTKLLKYCIRHGHWSIFEMAHAVLEINTTRAISAQLLRHKSFSFQEFSQRYASVKERPAMGEQRLAGETNRQSSKELELENATLEQVFALESARKSVDASWDAYNQLVNAGFATETARSILPLCTNTRLYMAGSIRSWIHYIELRCSQDTQKEHREIAESCRSELHKQIPIIIETAMDKKRTPE